MKFHLLTNKGKQLADRNYESLTGFLLVTMLKDWNKLQSKHSGNLHVLRMKIDIGGVNVIGNHLKFDRTRRHIAKTIRLFSKIRYIGHTNKF